jgi:hypothetical protein
VSDDHRVFAKKLVSFRVVTMPVCVEDKARHGAAESLQRIGQLLAHHAVIVIDDQNSVGSGNSADVTSAALEQIDIPGNIRRLELNVLLVREMTVVAVRQNRHRNEREQNYKSNYPLHNFPPFYWDQFWK